MAFIHKLKFFSLTKEEQLGKLSKKKKKKITTLYYICKRENLVRGYKRKNHKHKCQ